MNAFTTLACRRPRRVLTLGAVLVVVAAVMGGPLVNQLHSSLSEFEAPSSPTARAARLLKRASGAEDLYGLAALIRIQGEVGKSKAASMEQERVAGLLSHQRGFRGSYDYVDFGDPELVSLNRHETVVLATFTTRELAFEAAERLRPVLGHQGVTFGGPDLVIEEITHRSRTDLVLAELYAFPLLLLLSLWVFRGLIAAAMPLLVGVCSIVTTLLVLRIIDQFLSISVFALSLVIALGLGLAIDYSLFMVSRFREELGNADAATGGGASLEYVPTKAMHSDRVSTQQTHVAIATTFQTAGRTVLYSSLTVAGAMASLCLFPLPFLYSMGIAGALTALTAGAVSLIILPALLVILGARINALAPVWLRRKRGRQKDRHEMGTVWPRLVSIVMRRPGVIALASAAVLIAAGSPIIGLGLTPYSNSLLPASTEARQVEESLEHKFVVDPALLITDVVYAPRGSDASVFTYEQRIAHASGEPSLVRLLGVGRSTWTIAIPPHGDPYGSASERVVRRLRAVRAPFSAAVGGYTAWYMDLLTSLSSHLPIVLLIVAVTMFGMIMAMTGSVVLPIKTFVMNLLTLMAATGALVLAFQREDLASVFGFRGNGGLEPTNLVVLFTLAFAISCDYGVFLLGRIKEAHDSGFSNSAAVTHGLERTGRLVTAAALLFCIAMGALVTSSVLAIKELGFGTAIAVAIDASIVRCLLVPALMALLGDWNWWAPSWVRRLHANVSVRESVPSASDGSTVGCFEDPAIASGPADERRR